MRKVQVRIEKRYVVSFGGVELQGSFKEVNHMAGMKLLLNEKKQQIVLDFPPDSGLNELLANVLGSEETIEANIVKASPDLFAELKTSAKKEDKDAGSGSRSEDDGSESVGSGKIHSGSGCDSSCGGGDGDVQEQADKRVPERIHGVGPAVSNNSQPQSGNSGRILERPRRT